jgi:hypothetical protein
METTLMPFILTICELGGSWAGRDPVTTIHASRLEALASLIKYVRDNWDAEMDEDQQPSDDDELVEQYFQAVPEAYQITEARG